MRNVKREILVLLSTWVAKADDDDVRLCYLLLLLFIYWWMGSVGYRDTLGFAVIMKVESGCSC